MAAAASEFALLGDLAVLLGLSTVVIVGCHRIKLPAVVGLLATGILAGPHGLGLIGHVHEVELLAEVGVVLLMFVIGAELSLRELIRLKRPVFLGGGFQVSVTIVVAACLAGLWGASMGQSLFLGFLAALSSTAIVLKLMAERAELESPQGRVVLSTLIFQDLIVAPLMLITPLLAELSAGAGAMASTLGLLALKAVLFIGGVFLISKALVPRLLSLAVATRSREAVLLVSLGVCLATAYSASLLGLSLSLGAFLAGLIISESEYSLSALEGVLPFRDVFTSLFFISMGMLLDVGFLVDHLALAVGTGLGVAALKAVIAGGAALILGYPLSTAVLVGLALAQVGEFSFVLARSGQGAGLLDDAGYQLFLAASILTMCATPLFLRIGPRLADYARNLPLPSRFHDRPAMEEDDQLLNDHLVIAGYGPIGKRLARAARHGEIPYVIIEMNPDTVREAKAEGELIFHGDATSMEVLEHAHLEKARSLAVVINEPTAVRRLVDTARTSNPGLHILARARFVTEIEPLIQLGANEVVSEEYEASIAIFNQVLHQYLLPTEDIEYYTACVRAEGYGMLRNACPEWDNSLRDDLAGLGLSAMRVEAGSPLEGVDLAHSNLREQHGLTVAAVRRGGDVIANPPGGLRFGAGDVVYLFGERIKVSLAAKLFRNAASVKKGEAENSPDET